MSSVRLVLEATSVALALGSIALTNAFPETVVMLGETVAASALACSRYRLTAISRDSPLGCFPPEPFAFGGEVGRFIRRFRLSAKPDFAEIRKIFKRIHSSP
jgi:hypothetical protein